MESFQDLNIFLHLSTSSQNLPEKDKQPNSVLFLMIFLVACKFINNLWPDVSILVDS